MVAGLEGFVWRGRNAKGWCCTFFASFQRLDVQRGHGLHGVGPWLRFACIDSTYHRVIIIYYDDNTPSERKDNRKEE